ncbi:MAG: PorP/SprF family type IX secretion system membrane protein [Bacteroidota bacterium]
MKKAAIVFSAILLAITVNAQQVNMFGHYFYKPMVYNPAFTGYEQDVINIALISRSQWTAFKGAPRFNMLVADGNVMEEKMGLGLGLISDRKGLVNRIGITPAYSYRLKINDDIHLMFGVAVSVIDQTIDYSRSQVENTNDPTLFTDKEHTTSFDGNAGLALVWKGLEFGAAVPQLTGNKVEYIGNTNVRAYYAQERHYMGSLKYKFFISKEKGISIAPQGLVRFVANTPFQYDANINFDWKDKFWIGAAYKSDYAVGANAGICLHKRLSVGYSYDFIIGDIGNYSGMSHELLLNFKFGRNKKTEPVPVPEVVQEIPEEKKLETGAYAKRMDSLAVELKKSQAKIQALSDKLDQQAKIQSQVQVQQAPTPVILSGGNENKGVVTNTEGVIENGISFVTGNTKDFKDANNNIPKKGLYIVVGTFFYRDFAVAEAKRFVEHGHKNTSYIFHEEKQYNYVYIMKVNTREEAFEKVKEAKAAGISDLWVQVLTE